MTCRTLTTAWLAHIITQRHARLFPAHRFKIALIPCFSFFFFRSVLQGLTRKSVWKWISIFQSSIVLHKTLRVSDSFPLSVYIFFSFCFVFFGRCYGDFCGEPCETPRNKFNGDADSPAPCKWVLMKCLGGPRHFSALDTSGRISCCGNEGKSGCVVR